MTLASRASRNLLRGDAERGGRGWLLAALDLVFPALCPVCGGALGSGRRDPLCGACWEKIDRITPPWCEQCGLPFATWAVPDATVDAPAGRCGPCMLEAPPFAWARAAGVYAGPLREAIHALKFHGRRGLARPLGDLVLEQVGAEVPPDVNALVPVPLARARARERGFNQAELVTDRIGRGLDLPVRARWLTRTRATQPQADLNAAERRRNVRDAFVASSAVTGRYVIVVDDVLTTGATVGDCARALRAAGAHRVGVLTVARVV